MENPFDYMQQLTLQKEKEDASVGSVLSNIVGGFVEGFTTIPVVDEPQNTTDAIAKSVGHLFGFMGVVPFAGSVGKLLAKGMGNIYTKELTKGAEMIAKVSEMKSVPMYFADKVTEVMNKYGSSASREAMDFFVNKGISPKIVQSGLDIMGGAMHLGLASAISTSPLYELDFPERMKGMLHGMYAGGVFRAIGSAFPQANTLPQGTYMDKVIDALKTDNGLLRTISASMFMGLPSSTAGDPFEMQIYNYLQGALFGATEMSSDQRLAMKFLQEAPRELTGEKNLPALVHNARLAMKEKLNGWSKDNPMKDGSYLTEGAKQIVEEQVNPKLDALAAKFIKNAEPKQKSKKAEEPIDTIFNGTGLNKLSLLD